MKPASIVLQTSHPDYAGLVAAYAFNGATGAQVSESNLVGSGSVVAETPASCLYETSTEGQQLDLTSSAIRLFDYLNSWEDGIRADTDWTLAFYFEIKGADSGSRFQCAGNGTDNVYTFAEDYNGELFPFFISDFGGPTIPGANPASGDVMVHIRNDTSLNRVSYWVNGALQGVSNYSAPASSPSGKLKQIYLPAFNAARPMAIRDLRAWNVARTDARIAAEVADWWGLYGATGALAVDLAPATAPTAASTPSVAVAGAAAADLAPATAPASAQVLSPAAAGAVAVTAPLASASPAAQVLGVAPGAVAVDLPLASAAPAAQTPSVAAAGAAAVDLAPAAAPVTAQPLAAATQGAVALAPATAPVAALAPAVAVAGAAAVDLTPATAPAAALAPSAAPVAVGVDLVPASAGAAAVTLAPAAGAVAVDLAPAMAPAAAATPSVAVSGAAVAALAAAVGPAAAQVLGAAVAGTPLVVLQPAAAPAAAQTLGVFSGTLTRKTVRLVAVGGRTRLEAVGGRTRLEIP